MELKNNDLVQRVYSILIKFDENQSLIFLDTSAGTALERRQHL